jgi:hypothetical protein
MTEQHQLTDEIIEEIAIEKQWADNIGDVVFRHDDMRAAADWQLARVMAWLESNLGRTVYLKPEGFDLEPIWTVDVDDVLDDLKEAMRPQEGNND